jgi:hypothetical protein
LKFSTKNEDAIETETVMTKGAACLDSNRFWVTSLPLEKSSQTVRKSGLLPSPAVHYAQHKQRQRLLLRVLLQCVAISQREISAEVTYSPMATKEKNRFFYQCCESGMFITDPGSKKEEAREKYRYVILFFCCKFYKIVNSCIFEQFRKKLEPTNN